MKYVFFSLVWVSQLTAQECSHLWNKNLEINPSLPKRFQGDTFAGYGLLAYKNPLNLKWIVKGTFPKARFMSVETYTSTRKRSYDVLFDYQIEPNVGSQNPYREGVPMESSERDFTVSLVPAEGKSAGGNIVHISPTAEVHAIYYRIYAPAAEALSESDLPQIFAVNSENDEPMECPEPADAEFHPKAPQFLFHLVRAKERYDFKDAEVKNGHNSAIPYYLYAVNETREDELTLVRFKTPTFYNNQSALGPFYRTGEVTFWSLCTQNYGRGQTLNCSPDYLTKVDANGFATIVIGKGEHVKSVAEKRGYNFLEDRREANQTTIQFGYRNLYPTKEFEERSMYQGEYRPVGYTCPIDRFLSGGCDLN